MKLTQQIHTILNRTWAKGNGRRVATAVLLWAGLTVGVMAVVNVRYFRVINGIPHLPVVKSFVDVTSPKPGALVFDSLVGTPFFYTGKRWISFCTVDMPRYAADPVTYFQVVNGIPCLSIQAKLTGASIPGAIYFPTDSTGVQVNDGTGWSFITPFMNKTALTNGNAFTSMGTVTGANGVFVIPILSAAPTVTANASGGTDAGTIYIDAATADLKCYDGTAWQSLDCSGCPPNAAGITVGGDFAKMLASNDFKTVGYAYYDKDGSVENTSTTTFRWFLSSNADGSGTTTPLYEGTGNTYTFSYVDSLDGKYLNVGVTAFAKTGSPQSSETLGHWLLKNCPPQVSGVTVNGDFPNMSSNDFTPGYGYYDKEGNPEKASSAEYRWWLSDTPNGAENGTPTVVNDVYTYKDADDGKYINVGVKTKASTGFAQSAETIGSRQVKNCPPHVTAVTANGDFTFNAGNTQTYNAGYGYYDKEGNAEKASSAKYKWYISTATAGGGTTTDLGTNAAQSYTYTDTDDGKYLNLDVSTVAATGFAKSDTVTGSWLLKNCPPQVTGVTVNGDFPNMSSNDFKPGYGYFDKEGNLEKASSAEYRWWLSDTPNGAESGTPTVAGNVYTYKDADDGKYINVGVKTQASTGFPQSTEAVGSALLQNCPPQVTAVTANGDFTFNAGNTQTFNGGYSYYDKEGNAEKASSATYKWYLSASAGGGTTTDLGTSAALSYTYTDTDDGKYLNLEVTTKAATGFAQSAKTTGSWLLKNCPPQVTGVSINGTLKTSNVLNAGYAYYDKEGNPENTAGVVYNWWLSATAGGAPTGSPTTSGGTYTYKDADDGFYINVGVKVMAANGYSASTETVGSALVSNCPPQVGAVRVGGTLTSGQVVRAEYSYYDKEGNAEGTPTYQWYRATSASGTGAVAISGATFANYTLQTTDKTYYVGVKVTPKATVGFSLGTGVTGYGATVVN